MRSFRQIESGRVMHRVLFALTLSMMLLAGCRKEDNRAPQITVNSPFEQSGYVLPEAMSIDFSVKDNERLMVVTVQLKDPSFNPAGFSMTFSPNSRLFELDTTVMLNLPQLETGTYFLHISASDGANTTSEYIGIHITGIPNQLQQLLLVTSDGGNTSVNDVTSGQSLIGTVSGTFQAAAVDSWSGKLLCATSAPHQVAGFSLDPFQQLWSNNSSAAPPYPAFGTSKWHHDRKELVTVYQASGVAIIGTNGLEANISINYSPNHAVLAADCDEDYIVSLQQLPGGADRLIVVSFRNSGALAYTIGLISELVDVEYLEPGKFLIATNSMGVGNLRILNVQTQYLASPFGVHEILSMHEAGDMKLIRCNGGVYLCNEIGVPNIVAYVTPDAVAWDEISGRIYMAVFGQIREYTTNGTLLNAEPITGSPKAILPRYLR
jgi:hypothetical protein